MKRLTRYVLRQTLLLTLGVGVAFSLAVWLVQSLRLVDLIVNRGLSLGLFLYLAALILPRLVVVVLPVAVFVAVLFVYNKLTAESELVAMRSAGVSQGGLAKPALLCGCIAMAVLYGFSLYLQPASNRAFKDLQFKIRNQFASVLIQDGVFNTLSDHLMVYVMGRNAADELLSVIIYDTRDPEKPVTIFAERGAFADTPEGPRLLLVNGTRQQRDAGDGHLSVLTFAKYTLDLDELRDAPEIRDREPSERYTGDLLAALRSGESESTARALLVEMNLRLADPLAGLAMALLPVLCLLPGEFNRRGQTWRVLLAIALAFVFEVIDLGLKNLAARSELALPLLYVNALAPLAAMLWLLWNDRRIASLTRLAARAAR